MKHLKLSFKSIFSIDIPNNFNTLIKSCNKIIPNYSEQKYSIISYSNKNRMIINDENSFQKWIKILNEFNYSFLILPNYKLHLYSIVNNNFSIIPNKNIIKRNKIYFDEYKNLEYLKNVESLIKKNVEVLNNKINNLINDIEKKKEEEKKIDNILNNKKSEIENINENIREQKLELEGVGKLKKEIEKDLKNKESKLEYINEKIKSKEIELETINKNLEKSVKILEENKIRIENINKLKTLLNFEHKNKIEKKEEEFKENMKNKIILYMEKFENKFIEELNELKNKKINEYFKENEERSKLYNKISKEYEEIKKEFEITNKLNNSFLGVKCEICKKEIQGIRYECSKCKEYNLCEKCELKNYIYKIHTLSHKFYKIRKNIDKHSIKIEK